jgi:hypothetical protein
VSKKRYSANGWKLRDCGLLDLQIWIHVLILRGDNERLSLCDNPHTFQKLRQYLNQNCQDFRTKTLLWVEKYFPKLQGLLSSWKSALSDSSKR